MGVTADRGDLIPVNVSVESDAEPTSAADVRRSEEAFRLGVDQFILRTGWGRTPQMGEAILMMTARPQHHELLLDEERRRSVTELFGNAGQGHADRPDSFLQLFGHRDTVGDRKSWMTLAGRCDEIRCASQIAVVPQTWHSCGMSRTRLSTTVDAELLHRARALNASQTDATLIDEALAALLARHRAAETDAMYDAAYAVHPLTEPDEWGDLASFREAAAAT